MKCYSILCLLFMASSIFADDDTLRDMGTNAVPGEVAKWDGAEWQLAHDDVGVNEIVLGPGLSGSTSNGTTTVSVEFGSEGTNNLVARHVELDATRPPIGSVVAWLPDLPNVPTNLPSGWVECNGQVLSDTNSVLDGITIPNLNGAVGSGLKGRFLRGHTTSGELEDSQNLAHSHNVRGHTETYSAAYSVPTLYADGSHDNNPDSVPTTSSGGSEARPYNYSVVWIMRVR